jgi:hypothetical protein
MSETVTADSEVICCCFRKKAKEVKVAATNADVSTSSTAAAAVNLILETFVAATALPVDIYAVC